MSGEYEIWTQRLSAQGAEVGGSDSQVSTTGAPPRFLDERNPRVAPNPAAGEYLVVWYGDDITDDEFEVFGRRLGGGPRRPPPVAVPLGLVAAARAGALVHRAPATSQPRRSSAPQGRSRARSRPVPRAAPREPCRARGGAQAGHHVPLRALRGRARRVRYRAQAPGPPERQGLREADARQPQWAALHALCAHRRVCPGANAGRNRKRFSGRIAGRRLSPGRYRAALVATDAAGNASKPKRVAFRVVKQ